MTAATINQLATRSGLVIDVRPADPADEAALTSFFDRVSSEDRRFRFMAASAHISHEQLKPLVTADHFRSQSFLAFDHASGELVASALLACDNQLDTAEIAISVQSDHKGCGVGWALLDFLANEAQRRGVRRVISIESRDNHATIELEREHGFTPEVSGDDPALVILSRNFR